MEMQKDLRAVSAENQAEWQAISAKATQDFLDTQDAIEEAKGEALDRLVAEYGRAALYAAPDGGYYSGFSPAAQAIMIEAAAAKQHAIDTREAVTDAAYRRLIWMGGTDGR